MANLALLSGIGAGMQSFGNEWGAAKRQELSEQLDKEREERAEQRQVAREERQRKRDEGTPSEFKIERTAEGATFRVPYNKMGQRLGGGELASAQDIKDYNFEDQKQKLTLESLVTKSARDKETHEANLDYKEASTEAARARAERTRNLPLDGSGDRASRSKEATPADYAAQLAKEAKAELDTYDISATQRAKLVEEAVAQSTRYGVHPSDILKELLYERQYKKKGAQTSAGGTGGLKLNPGK